MFINMRFVLRPIMVTQIQCYCFYFVSLVLVCYLRIVNVLEILDLLFVVVVQKLEMVFREI